MSRIGNKLIKVPEGLNVTVGPDMVDIKGKNGEDKIKYDPRFVAVELKDGIIKVTRVNDEKRTKQIHGTTRAILNNAIVGCHDGFTKELEIVGIGYHTEVKDKNVVLHVGYSHPVLVPINDGITVTVKDTTKITITGSNKFDVGQVAANIRNTRRPEPYQGKGIKYKGEVIIRKEGKRATATAGGGAAAK